jgi:hypothetical protein
MTRRRLLFPVAGGIFADSPDWPAVAGEAFDAGGLLDQAGQGHDVVIVGDLTPEHCARLASRAQAGYTIDRVRLSWRRGSERGSRYATAIVKKGKTTRRHVG